MPKYRLLTSKELQDLEKEFIEYLVLNGIDVSSWQDIKKKDSHKAEQIIDLFSDVVFEKILRRTQYLFQIANGLAFAFRFLEDKAQLYILEIVDEIEIEATEEALIRHLEDEQINNRIHFQEKDYNKPREKSIFELMEAGAWVSEGRFFNYLMKSHSN